MKTKKEKYYKIMYKIKIVCCEGKTDEKHILHNVLFIRDIWYKQNLMHLVSSNFVDSYVY
jgi:hypothetical protein